MAPDPGGRRRRRVDHVGPEQPEHPEPARRSSISRQQEKSRATERYGEKHPEYQKAVTALANAERSSKRKSARPGRTPRTSSTTPFSRNARCSAQLGRVQAAGHRAGPQRRRLRGAAARGGIEPHDLQPAADARKRTARRRQQPHQQRARRRQGGSARACPISPNHRRDWAYAIALGLALGLGLAFGIDYLDDTVKTPDDISRRLKLKFLGLVPIVAGDRHPLISGPVPHDFGEAYRSIRTALAAQLPGNGRAHRRGRQLAAARRQDHDGGEHRDGAGGRRRARAADRRRHAPAQRAQGAAHDQRPRPVAAAGRPGAHARSGAAHARSRTC